MGLLEKEEMLYLTMVLNRLAGHEHPVPVMQVSVSCVGTLQVVRVRYSKENARQPAFIQRCCSLSPHNGDLMFDAGIALLTDSMHFGAYSNRVPTVLQEGLVESFDGCRHN